MRLGFSKLFFITASVYCVRGRPPRTDIALLDRQVLIHPVAKRMSRPWNDGSGAWKDAGMLTMDDDIKRSMQVVRSLLDTTRNPQHPTMVSHTYSDKYFLVETAARAAISAQLRALSMVGLGAREISVLQTRGKDRTTTLAFEVEQKCSFLSTRQRYEQDATKTVVEKEGGIFGGGTATFSSSTLIVEHTWKVRGTVAGAHARGGRVRLVGWGRVP